MILMIIMVYLFHPSKRCRTLYLGSVVSFLYTIREDTDGPTRHEIFIAIVCHIHIICPINIHQEAARSIFYWVFHHLKRQQYIVTFVSCTLIARRKVSVWQTATPFPIFVVFRSPYVRAFSISLMALCSFFKCPHLGCFMLPSFMRKKS